MKKIDLFKLLIITNCCNILVYFFQPNYISLAIIVMSVICIVKLAVKKQVQRSCFGIMLAVWLIKTIIAIPYLVPILFHLPGVIALIVLLKKPSIKWYKIILWFTIISAVVSLVIEMVFVIENRLDYIVDALNSSLLLASYIKKFIFAQLPELAACFGFPAFAVHLRINEK